MTEKDEFYYRTEDLRLEEVLNYFVETAAERLIIDMLKSRSPVVLRGSRGVGKSFLLRVAEAELRSKFVSDRILPVYITFSKSVLVQDCDQNFIPWMILRISSGIKRACNRYGLSLPDNGVLRELILKSRDNAEREISDLLAEEFEESYKHGSSRRSNQDIPDVDELREAIQDLCEELGVNRVVLLIDEAAHIFIPTQQRDFFTLMRDLRSPWVSVKAAVYPGVTSYGPSFQPTHDAMVVNVEHSVSEQGYAQAMREIVLKQSPGSRRLIEQYGEAFDVLAFASMGNPRVLLKTYSASMPFNRSRAQNTLREYYRHDIWSEHSALAERYPGHRQLIDWGRDFVEKHILPDLHSRNSSASESSSAIWIHRDAPRAVREALSLLCYSNILLEDESGIRATRSEIGTRYFVNFGCNFALDGDPVSYGARVRRSFSVKRMKEFGANSSLYKPIQDLSFADVSGNPALRSRLNESYSVLDLTKFQKSKLHELGVKTIQDVLNASEEQFLSLRYVGPVRSRQMRNAAQTAVFEYLSG